MQTDMQSLQGLYDEMRTQIDLFNEDIEPSFIQMVKDFEDCGRKWLSAQQQLASCKEVLTKTETERSALEVKLKHARNQVDVEIRRRMKAESDCEKLNRQIQLIRDLLTSEGSSDSIQLSAEQRSALAFLNTNCQAAASLNTSRRLMTIDESASILSDISDDKTDDSLDWDSSDVRTVRLKKREEQENETLVTKTKVTVPVNGGPVEVVFTIETVPYWTRSRRNTAAMEWDSESVNSDDDRDGQGEAAPGTPQSHGGVRLHEFDSETGVLAHYVPDTTPMIPPLVVHCVSEIELRGLHEAGLYCLSGADRTVKDLKEKFLRSKTVPVLSEVDDINAITGLLKDFLRNLKEPLLTFRLNRTFMEAAEVSDDDNSMALMYQTISDLPQPNRDTLAFLVLHLKRVADSLNTRMDISNLAQVFGPTIVGHAVPNPDPMTILQDTRRQPKVVERLLALPVDYWAQFVMAESDTQNLDHLIIFVSFLVFSAPFVRVWAPLFTDFIFSCNVCTVAVSILGPLTTPEHQLNKTPSASSLSQRLKSTLDTQIREQEQIHSRTLSPREILCIPTP